LLHLKRTFLFRHKSIYPQVGCARASAVQFKSFLTKHPRQQKQPGMWRFNVLYNTAPQSEENFRLLLPEQIVVPIIAHIAMMTNNLRCAVIIPHF
jgi:hypothetical protein